MLLAVDCFFRGREIWVGCFFFAGRGRDIWVDSFFFAGDEGFDSFFDCVYLVRKYGSLPFVAIPEG